MLNDSEVNEQEISSISIKHLKECDMNVFYVILKFLQFC